MQRMLLFARTWKFLALFTVTVFFPPTVSAGLIDPVELITVVQSTIADFDVSVIGIHRSHATGQNSSGSFTQSLVVNSTGWNSTLMGSYDGVPVVIDYAGTLTFLGGPNNQFAIGYTSNWLINGQSGTGSGSGSYTDPEFSFDVDLINMSVSGSISVSYGLVSLTLSGTKDTDDQELEVSGEIALVDLVIIDASLVSGAITFTLNQATGEYESVLSTSALNFIDLSTQTINDNEGTTGSGTTSITSTTNVVPEPSTWLLLGSGLTILLLWRRKAHREVH